MQQPPVEPSASARGGDPVVKQEAELHDGEGYMCNVCRMSSRCKEERISKRRPHEFIDRSKHAQIGVNALAVKSAKICRHVHLAGLL